MNTRTELKPTLLIAAAALLATGMQLAGIDALARPQKLRTDVAVVQLEQVVVVGRRETVATVHQLPRVVVVTRRLEAVASTPVPAAI